MSENKQTTDSELLLQIVGYNQNAFEELYNRYSATIYSLIKEIVTNPKLSEKILLNAFSVFLKRIEYYSTTSNDIFTWLTLLARNISVDALKRMKFVEDIPIYSDDYEIEFMLPNLSQEITPINLDERTVLGEKIKSYKSHLTEVQNLVLSLIYFEGLYEEEIAKRLNVPVVTIRQRILSIMESLHHQYTGQTEDAKSNKEVLNLIKLDALGCLSSEERILFNELRKNEPDFLWKELGEYQNLTALLATSIPAENPEHELNGEIRNIFTRILQGSEVDYPIVAPEPAEIKQYQEPISESIQQRAQNPIPEIIKQPEIQEKKKPEFELKFRERDPKELSLLKKIETVELDQRTPTDFAKKNIDVKLKDYNTVVKKTNFFVDKKEDLSVHKTSIPVALKAESTIHHQTTSLDINRTELKIGNDDPSIIIEEPKPVVVKEDVTVKNRLIPNSSINLKELFKKEEKPTAPIFEKFETIIKANETPKKFSSSIFVNKDEKSIQTKTAVPVVQKPDITIKSNESLKVIQKPNPIVVREEKPAVSFIEKSEIKIKINETPSEFRRSNVFVDKVEKILESKHAVPVVQKTEIENKTNVPIKEIEKANTLVVKEEKKVDEKLVATVVEKSDIKIKTNEPPKEFSRSNVFVDRDQKTIQSKPILRAVEKTELENKKNKEIKDIQNINTVVAKEEKSVEIKKPEVVKNADLKTGVQEPLTQKEKINPEIKKDENLFERIKPTVDRSNLKIRETVFVENEKKSEIIKQEIIAVASESKPEIDKINPASNLTEAINIDEILSKIEDEKPAPVILSEAESYEKEIVKLRKQLRRNLLVSAAMFAILIASSIFVYLKFQEAPVKVADKVNTSEELSLAGQTNLITFSEYSTSTESENTRQTIETASSKETATEKKVVIPPLPKISIMEESTLFASNIKESLMSDISNENTQIAAAKTETIVPIKENKNIEEEPAFFVAVEEMPELIGGIKGLQSKIVYPEIARKVGIEGKVIIQAIVDETGKVISVNTIKGIGSGCDEVAMDAVRNSKFTPGKQRGKTVKTQITIPIVFKK